MTITDQPPSGHLERMSDLGFKMMQAIMRVEDFVHPYIDERVQTFGTIFAL